MLYYKGYKGYKGKTLGQVVLDLMNIQGFARSDAFHLNIRSMKWDRSLFHVGAGRRISSKIAWETTVLCLLAGVAC